MNTTQRYYAHSQNDRGQWHNLQEHLEGVARRAKEFGGTFGASEWTWLAGLWHDLGKYSDRFQRYLIDASSSDFHHADIGGPVDHSTAGAQHAVESIPILGHLLAYVVSGHHSGLLDGRSDGTCLETRLHKEVENWRQGLPDQLTSTLNPPTFIREAIGSHNAFTVAFFVRMLYSSLVDADFLDTEQHLNPERMAARPCWPNNILEQMAICLQNYTANLECQAEATSINRERARIRDACIQYATCTPGLFSLTVPTGGGKTLSSLAFALRHAIHHSMDRVIYVIPFTSIIEQNADVFRKVMASLIADGVLDPVIEHHSAIDVDQESVAGRLSSENWDAPLVVTTSVQFYESLFANRSSKCRKLHNIARSVIILDEAQAIPVEYLDPCLRAIHELTANYGTSLVLCTATQPAVHHRQGFRIGLKGVREIIENPRNLYQSLQRVKVVDLGRRDDKTLAEDIRQHPQVLCIVNTRSHARKLSDALGEEGGHFHLSALMCPEHRTHVLARIRERLSNGSECRVISTQLIEAGVDIDFPIVYRSLAGIDALAQAAGRCNRNGRIESLGKVFIFRSEHMRSEAFFRDTTNIAEQVLPLYEDPLSLDTVERYFKLYYWDQSTRWDQKKICDDFQLVQDRALPFLFGFTTAAKKFQIIEDSGREVIIPWGETGVRLCEEIVRVGDVAGIDLLRRLQRYSVQIPSRVWSGEYTLLRESRCSSHASSRADSFFPG